MYGLAEATAKRTQLANAWTSEQAIDESRRKTEREAFEKLLDEFENTWNQVINTCQPHLGAAPLKPAIAPPGHKYATGR